MLLKSCATEIFSFSKYHCTTLTAELELDVPVCAQFKLFLPIKTASHGLILQKNLSQIDVKGKFFVSQEKAQGKTKNSVVVNLNISANCNDINTLKV